MPETFDFEDAVGKTFSFDEAQPPEQPGRITKQPQTLGEWGRFMVGGLLHPIRAAETGIEQFAIQHGLAEPGSQLLPGLSLGRALETPIVGTIPKIKQQKSVPAQLGAAAVNTVTDFVNFFGTPEGLGTLGLGALPKAASRAILADYATEMAMHTPEQIQGAIEEAKKGNWQGAAQNALGAAGASIMVPLIAKHTGAPPSTHPSVTLPKSLEALKEPPAEAPPAPEVAPTPAEPAPAAQETFSFEQAKPEPAPPPQPTSEGGPVGPPEAAAPPAAPETPAAPAAPAPTMQTQTLLNGQPVKVLETNAKKGTALVEMPDGTTERVNAKDMETRQVEVPETQGPPGAPEPAEVPRAIQSLDEAANRAKQRIDSRSGIKFGMSVDPVDTARAVADWAIIGAAKLARGGYDVAKWSQEMVAELGDQIKPYIEQVYRQAGRLSGRIQEGIEAQRSAIGEILSGGVDARTQEQAAFGASLMQQIIREKGSIDLQDWYDGMAREFGEDVRNEAKLQELYTEARDLMSEGTPIPAGRNPTPFTSGQARITVGERTALREVLSKAEAAGAAGRKAGEVSKAAELAPVISGLQDKLSDSISKAQALGEYLRGQEVGGARAGRATRTEAAQIDRWLEADSDNIRTSLNQLAKGLPLEERGKFVSAITSAMKRPSLFNAKAVETMYRKAAQVAARIESRIGEVETAAIEKDITDFKRAAQSPSIDVEFRKRIHAQLDNYNRLKKAGGLDRDALEALRDRLTSLRDIGRSEQTTKEALWEWQKEFAQRRLAQQPTRPVETRPELRPSPGESATIGMRIKNWINSAMNRADKADKAILPIDALFDLMELAKGTYRGWLFRNARGPVDLGFNEAKVRRNGLLERFETFVKDNGLTGKNAERIGVYAQNLQKGGRERLIESGLSGEAIDKITSSLTRAELGAYNMMRQVMDSQLPAVQRLMGRLYNTDVKPVENYFPMPRDWREFEGKPAEAKAPGTEAAYDDLATWKALRDDYSPRPTAQTRKGFTQERQPGAKTPIRIDAFDIFRQHINDVSYLLELQPTIKSLGEIGRGDLFRQKYGDVGQKMFLGWLDTVARQGGMESFKRWKLLDTLRKNTSVGIVGFRLGSQLVHLSNIPYIVARIGPWFGTGLRETFTERGKAFLERNFAETQERAGGEPAQAEAEKEGRILGIPKSGGVVRASMAIARRIDRVNSEGSVLGSYLKILKDKGADWQNYDKIPLDREAAALALVFARRAIASPLPKDVPQALSRGTITGGNVSLGRSIFQFQNIFLDQWSNIRHDLVQAGIIEKNPKQAAAMFLAVVAATLAESGIKIGSKQAVQSLMGTTPPKKKQDKDELMHKAMHELVRRFPFGGQLATQAQYGETGIPVLDTVSGVAHHAYGAATYKKEKARRKAAIRTGGSIAQLLGVPGASQIAEVISASQ